MKEDLSPYVMSTIDDDKKRFTDIYNRESDSLFRFCLTRVTDRERALDITQEAFTRLWNSIVTGKVVENPRALLFVIARNLIIDWYRRTKSVSLEGMSLGDEDREFDPPDPEATVDIEMGAEVGRVLRMLDNLEPQFKEVIYFRYVEDLPPKDIAEILELNPNTVSVRLTRGMEALRGLMGIQENER
ncbi:MAG: RNA polymerase sigma factor [Minisyncoccia bacterium]